MNITPATINTAAKALAIKTTNEELALIGDATRIAFFCETYFGEFIGMTADGEKVGMVEAWVEDGHKDHPFSGFAFHTYKNLETMMTDERITLMVQL